MTLEELFTRKGELITQIEIAQAKLQSVNQEIVKQVNQQSQGSPNTEKQVNGAAVETNVTA